MFLILKNKPQFLTEKIGNFFQRKNVGQILTIKIVDENLVGNNFRLYNC